MLEVRLPFRLTIADPILTVELSEMVDGRICITFSEEVDSFQLGNIEVSGGTLDDFTGNHFQYCVAYTKTGATMEVYVPAGVAMATAAPYQTNLQSNRLEL